jgi:hypothetical protein
VKTLATAWRAVVAFFSTAQKQAAAIDAAADDVQPWPGISPDRPWPRQQLSTETMKRIEQGHLRMFRDQRPITQVAEMAPPEEFFRWSPSAPVRGAEDLKRSTDLPENGGLELLMAHGFPAPEQAPPAEPTASEN